MNAHVLKMAHSADRTEVICETCGWGLVVYTGSGKVELADEGDRVTCHSLTNGNIRLTASWANNEKGEDKK